MPVSRTGWWCDARPRLSPWPKRRISALAPEIPRHGGLSGWSFVPTTIILLTAGLVSFYAYQRVTEDLVLGRNQELARLSVGQLAADVTKYADLLTGLARKAQQLASRKTGQSYAAAARSSRRDGWIPPPPTCESCVPRPSRRCGRCAP